MAPQRFEIGQPVTPNHKDWNNYGSQQMKSPSPKFGEIYHVFEYFQIPGEDFWSIILYEFPKHIAYAELGFDPVIETLYLEKDLNKISKPEFV